MFQFMVKAFYFRTRGFFFFFFAVLLSLFLPVYFGVLPFYFFSFLLLHFLFCFCSCLLFFFNFLAFVLLLPDMYVYLSTFFFLKKTFGSLAPEICSFDLWGIGSRFLFTCLLLGHWLEF